MRGHVRLLVMLLRLLGLLLGGKLETLLKYLHHVVVFLLITYQFLIKDLVDVRYRLFYLCKHLFKLAFKLRHNLSGHCLLELRVDDLTDCLVVQIR